VLVLLIGTVAASLEAGTTTTTRWGARSPSAAVVVRTDRTSYAADATPVVVIRNGLKRAIVATTGRTECSIVALDRLRGTVWTEVRNCYSGEPPRAVRIAAGATVRIRLVEALDAGTYRARLEFDVGGRPARAVSASLRIG
jgi:hypothetical protein